MTFDSRDPGTASAEWMQDPRWARLPSLDLGTATGLLVLAAHPDDETLGAGGLIATARRAGLPVTVVVVTDGAAGASAPAGLAAVRASEAADAMLALGVTDLRLLGFADGAVREDRDEIGAVLDAIASYVPGRILVAPWTGDGHRDHRVLGEIAVDLAARVGAELWAYPIWLWHWGTPDDAAVPWHSFRALALDADALSAKERALAGYPSQTTGTEPMLHERFREHFARQAEVFVTPASSR